MFKEIIRYSAFLIIGYYNFVLFASQHTSFKATFKREVISSNRKEKVEGVFYFISPNKIFIDVVKPIKQNVFVKENAILIYYPDEKVGFEIQTSFNTLLSFLNNFLILSLDKVLADMKYKLVKTRTENKLVYYEYKAPSNMPIKTVTVCKLQNKVLKLTAQDKNGKIICETSYDDYFEGVITFPKKIKTVIFEPNGSINEERTIYNDIEINPAIPDRYTNFAFPEGTSVKKIKY